MPVPSQGHFGFSSFPVVDWFCLFVYLRVLPFPFQKRRQIWHKLDKIILKVPMSKYVPIILRTENVLFGVLSQHFFLTKSDVKTQQSPHKRCQTLKLIWIFLCFNATFNNISAILWRPVFVVEEAGEKPPTMGKQLVSLITCGCESSAPVFVIYKAGR